MSLWLDQSTSHLLAIWIPGCGFGESLTTGHNSAIVILSITWNMFNAEGQKPFKIWLANLTLSVLIQHYLNIQLYILFEEHRFSNSCTFQQVSVWAAYVCVCPCKMLLSIDSSWQRLANANQLWWCGQMGLMAHTFECWTLTKQTRYHLDERLSASTEIRGRIFLKMCVKKQGRTCVSKIMKNKSRSSIFEVSIFNNLHQDKDKLVIFSPFASS